MLNAADFVYVKQDGSVRELSRDEREYLATEFPPFDGGRPYIKSSYESKNGWGSLSGFLMRSHLPPGIAVLPIDPAHVQPAPDVRRLLLGSFDLVGDTVTENRDGSISVSPQPGFVARGEFRPSP